MWTKRGNFSLSPAPGAGSNRNIAYICTTPSSVITELKLVEVAGGVIFTVKAPTDIAYVQLKQALLQAGFPEPGRVDIEHRGVMAIFRSASDPRVQTFINMLRSVCNLGAIVDELNNYIASVVTRPPASPRSLNRTNRGASSTSTRRVPRWYTPGVGHGFMPHYTDLSFRGMYLISNEESARATREWRNAVAADFAAYRESEVLNIDVGDNARKLEELGWAGGVPEEYECPLTLQIMTNPVYDLKHPRIKFEKNSIYLALETQDPRNRRNPMTRTPLAKEQLINDTELRKEIMYFMKDVCRAEAVRIANTIPFGA